MRIAALILPTLLVGCATIADRPAAPAAVWQAFDANAPGESGAWGLADRATGRALTPHDPVRIASISKLVVALGAMRLVEQGRLGLDTDVSQMLGWPLRNPAFPDTPITLRLLLSHQSSLQDELDYAIPLGSTVRQTLADAKAYDPEHAPGTFFRYANLNYPVIASVMEAAAGERFDRLMHRLVLAPLRLDACFNWTTCSDSAIARAAVLYGTEGEPIRDDLRGRKPDCPVLAPDGAGCDLSGYRPGENGALFSPQGGLRVSAADLATIGRLLLNQGRHDGAAFLSPASVAEMTRPHWRYDGANGDTTNGIYCAYGLGVQSLRRGVADCDDDLFGGGRPMIGHAGEAYGVRSGLWVDPARRMGIAFFATGAHDATQGRSAYTPVEESLAARLR